MRRAIVLYAQWSCTVILGSR